MSIFSKIFGGKGEDVDPKVEDAMPQDNVLFTTGPTDRPAETDIPRPEAVALAAAGEELARRVSGGLSELAGILKVINEQVAAQRSATETLSRSSRKQVEILENLDGKLKKIAETSGDDVSLRAMGNSLKEEVKILEELERGIAKSNRQLSEALEQIAVTLGTLPAAEARQAELMESIREQLGRSANLQIVLQEISDRTREQSQMQSVIEKNLRAELRDLGRKVAGRTRFTNLVLVLVFLTILILGIIAVSRLSGITDMLKNPPPTNGTGESL